MTVMSKAQETLLRQLLGIARDPEVLEEALRSLNAERSEPPELRAIIRRILEIRQRNEAAEAQAAAS